MFIKNLKDILHGSSIGLGHWPFTSVRRVRFPYRVPLIVSIWQVAYMDAYTTRHPLAWREV